jgi:hypothetical protein
MDDWLFLTGQNGSKQRSRRGGDIAADQGELKLALQWMKFNEVSSYRIMEWWGANLRKFWSTGGGGFGWRQ